MCLDNSQTSQGTILFYLNYFPIVSVDSAVCGFSVIWINQQKKLYTAVYHPQEFCVFQMECTQNSDNWNSGQQKTNLKNEVVSYFRVTFSAFVCISQPTPVVLVSKQGRNWWRNYRESCIDRHLGRKCQFSLLVYIFLMAMPFIAGHLFKQLLLNWDISTWTRVVNKLTNKQEHHANLIVHHWKWSGSTWLHFNGSHTFVVSTY